MVPASGHQYSARLSLGDSLAVAHSYDGAGRSLVRSWAASLCLRPTDENARGGTLFPVEAAGIADLISLGLLPNGRAGETDT